MYRAAQKTKNLAGAIVFAVAFAAALSLEPCLHGQTGGFNDQNSGLRPVQAGSVLPSTSAPVMVPLNSPGPIGFDPYASNPSRFSGGGGILTPQLLVPASSLPPVSSSSGFAQPYSTFQPGIGQPALGGGVFPSYTGPPPILPGAGQSAIVQTSPSIAPYQATGPGLYPNSTPSALFPGTYNTGNSGSLFGDWFGGLSGQSSSPGFGGGVYPGAAGNNAPMLNPNLSGSAFGGPNYGAPGYAWPSFGGAPGGYTWNPQGTAFNGQFGQPPTFIRLFQGPRFRYGYINGNRAFNALAINDFDVALAFLIPQFLFSTQPLYLLPSFGLHLWSGPRSNLDPSGNASADLPSNAFSAFLDSGWQSDPAKIFGAELGLRVGVFSAFDAINSESLRILGRGIGRVRLTPQSTLKLGVIYLDRNRVELLPAGGILWQPNPGTRLDIFFPEPKLAAYLTTLGNIDTWWYVAGYYGGGTWTINRDDGSRDSVDINDIRVVAGLEWGRNDMLRDGRRMGFFEVGYVFDRELYYKRRPQDNMDLQNNFIVRVGFGY